MIYEDNLLRFIQRKKAILLGECTINDVYDDLFKNPMNICHFVENDYKYKLYEYGLTDFEIECLYEEGHAIKIRQYIISKTLQKMEEEEIAATIIQNAYLHAHYNPKFKLCRLRLMRQFDRIFKETHNSKKVTIIEKH